MRCTRPAQRQNELAILLVTISTAFARAEITATADKLDPSDGLPMPPANIVVADVAVSVTADDVWYATGLRGETHNGARFVYAHDPNGVVLPTAPGTDNRFVTFFSRPRDRDANV